jgi:ASPIC and UnbV
LRAIDIDNDGWIHLAAMAPEGVLLASNRKGRFEAQATPASGLFLFSDFENRGFADLVAGNLVYRNLGLARLAKPISPAGFWAGVAWAEADFDSDGRNDLAAVAPDGSIHLLMNRTGIKNEWLRITLTGVKSLKTAPGTEVEIKSGNSYQKKLPGGISLTFGLGEHSKADTVRVSWANGMIQNLPNEAAGRTLAIKETPRLSGSCAMIFTCERPPVRVHQRRSGRCAARGEFRRLFRSAAGCRFAVG